MTDDFYRLPFPNDLRRVHGKLDLGELPSPPAALPPFDLAAKYLAAAAEDGSGFGLHPVVFFRFSRKPAVGSSAGVHQAGAVGFVDVTPGAPERGQVIPHRVRLAPDSRYLCASALAIEPATAAPLLPGHTYAVWLTAAVTDEAGAAMRADSELAVVLGGQQPAGEARAAAWRVYAPMRSWLAEQPRMSTRTLISAAVFTTQAADAPAALRAAVQAAAAPQVTELVTCGEGQPSSCDDTRTATCAAVARDERFVEYRGRVTLPVFQAGTPPYEFSGGAIAYQQGRPQVARTEGVCFTLTVPRGQAPTGGWPLVIYSHGTGGDHRNHVDAGLAGELAAGGMEVGAAIPMASLGYDGVLHGSRKGTSARSTEDLVYNVFNPAAARGNGLQAAADLFALVRALPVLSAAAPLDASRVGLYGHSQGGNAAAVASGYEPAFGVVVLSGTGGGLTRSLLAKTKPVNIAALLPGLLGESAAVDVGHPVLSLLQMYFDAADPLNHGRRIVLAPPAGVTARHLLHVFGADDHYAPETTQRDFGTAAGLPVLDPVSAEDGDDQGVRIVVLAPVRANLAFGPGAGAGKVTAVQSQYRPDGYDGHFVSTHNPRARRAVQRMLGTFFRDGMPVVE